MQCAAIWRIWPRILITKRRHGGEAEWPPPAVERRLEVVDRAHRLFRVRAAAEGST